VESQRPCTRHKYSRKKRKERKKDYASNIKLLTPVKENGPLGKENPFTRKEKGGQ